MTPEELNNNFVQAVVWYCNDQADSNRYFECQVGETPFLDYRIGTLDRDGFDQWIVGTWELKIDQPTNSVLALPVLADVLTFYENAYANPNTIIQSQPFAPLTSTQIAEVETAKLRQDSIITDTTLNRNFKLSGTDWIPSGKPNYEHTSHHIGEVSAVTFDAGEVKSIPYTGVALLNSGFTYNSSTGVTTYNGALPQKLHIAYTFGVAQNVVNTPGALHSFVNINGQNVAIPTSQFRVRSSWNGVSDLAEALIVPVAVIDYLLFNPLDEISLGGSLLDGAAQSLNFYDVSCQITV